MTKRTSKTRYFRGSYTISNHPFLSDIIMGIFAVIIVAGVAFTFFTGLTENVQALVILTIVLLGLAAIVKFSYQSQKSKQGIKSIIESYSLAEIEKAYTNEIISEWEFNFYRDIMSNATLTDKQKNIKYKVHEKMAS